VQEYTLRFLREGHFVSEKDRKPVEINQTQLTGSK